MKLPFSKKTIKADVLGDPVSPIQPATGGQQEVSKFHPSYEFLVRLIKLISKVAPEAIPEIKAISSSQPFFTVNDVGDLTAKIWTLATTKYNIPRAWLISKLPEKKIKSFLKKADLWPSQNETENMLTQSPGAIAFNNPKDTTVCGPNSNDIKAASDPWDIVVDLFLSKHKRWSEVVKALRQADPNVTDSVILSLKDRVRKSLDNQLGMVGSSKKVVDWMGQGWWVSPTGEVQKLAPNEEHEKNMPSDVEIEDEDDPMGSALANGWVRARKVEGSNELGIFVANIHYIPDFLNDFIIQVPSELIGVDDGNNYVVANYEDAVNNGLQKAVDKALQLKRMKNKTAKRHLNMDQVIKILDSKDSNKVDHINFIDNTIELLDGTVLTFNEATQKAKELDKTADVFQGSDFSHSDTVTTAPESSPEDHGKKDQKLVWPNTNWLPSDDENKDEQPWSNIAASKKPFSKKALLSKKANWWSSSSSGSIELEMSLEQAESVSGQGQHDEDARYLVKELRSQLDQIDPKVLASELKEYGAWNDAELADHEENLQRLVWIAGNDITEHEFEQENTGVDVDIQELPTLDKDQRIDELLEQLSAESDPQKKEKIKQHINRIKMASLYVKSNPATRFWIAPDGREFPIHSIHPVWIRSDEGKKALRSYGLDNRNDIHSLTQAMFTQGWSRISNEPAGSGFQIEVSSLNKIPKYLDDFVARNFKKGEEILIGTSRGGVRISDPFPSLQKATDKELFQDYAGFKKKAAISGKIVRDILEIVESSGGITYNLQKGNLAGTDNYSVSVYPDREIINPGVVEFDDIQHYIDTNEDLLSDPNNSLGIWSHKGQIYYDVVVTIPDKEQALKLGRENNQLSIFDLKNMVEIPTGIVRAFNKTDIVKKAEESPLTEDQANQISSASCPAYIIALNNFYSAFKRGHDKQKSIDYAIFSTKNLEKIDEKKLVEFINTYLGPVK